MRIFSVEVGKWTRWYAWHPVLLYPDANSGTRTWVWLETVERCGIQFLGFRWEYRLL